ncbi:hypothetical protein XELAEV_18011444mg [Xenopus laevis]|uniref:Uncharacterized protein n=1 Tax=Xenopus laevis TaxID=8355 RepID=A0A974DKR7_XENLA|nr:hypothetical protein XELAEV_18011444mg [Xenopus laevis]
MSWREKPQVVHYTRPQLLPFNSDTLAQYEPVQPPPCLPIYIYLYKKNTQYPYTSLTCPSICHSAPQQRSVFPCLTDASPLTHCLTHTLPPPAPTLSSSLLHPTLSLLNSPAPTLSPFIPPAPKLSPSSHLHPHSLPPHTCTHTLSLHPSCTQTLSLHPSCTHTLSLLTPAPTLSPFIPPAPTHSLLHPNSLPSSLLHPHPHLSSFLYPTPSHPINPAPHTHSS